jgi:FMN phosphatase YigB (HAD superfamily)
MSTEDAIVKWLLVDIGDVLLLKNNENTKEFSELLADQLGVDITLANEINKAHYTTMETEYIPEEQFVANLQEDLGYTAPKDIYSCFARAYEVQTTPNTELIQFFEVVRGLGFKTAVLSNTIGIYRDIQDRAGISKKGGFDPIILSWEVKMRKPNADIFELAVEMLQAKPEEIIFIDDKIGHLNGAAQVGIRTLLFENTKDTIAQIRQLRSPRESTV